MINEKVRRLTVSAAMLSLATVLKIVSDLIPFLNLPFGGTITLASFLPIVIVAYMYGTKWGLYTGFAYSLINVFRSVIRGSSGTVVAMFMPESDEYMGFHAVIIILLDYLLAYTVLGFGGIFRRIKSKTAAMALGVAVAYLSCYIIHVASGAIYYGSWAEWFFTDTDFAKFPISQAIINNTSGGVLALLYSAIYNGCYIIPDMIIAMLASTLTVRISAVKRYSL